MRHKKVHLILPLYNGAQCQIVITGQKDRTVSEHLTCCRAKGLSISHHMSEVGAQSAAAGSAVVPCWHPEVGLSAPEAIQEGSGTRWRKDLAFITRPLQHSTYLLCAQLSHAVDCNQTREFLMGVLYRTVPCLCALPRSQYTLHAFYLYDTVMGGRCI